MNYSNHYFSLDIHEVVSQVSLSVKRGDTSRKLNIALTENGHPYEIGADCAVVFSGKKADGTILYNECLVKNNAIEYVLTPQTTSAVGMVECEILIYGPDSRVLYNPCFSIVVYTPSFNSDDVVESTDEFSALTQIMSRLETAIDEAEAAIKLANKSRPRKVNVTLLASAWADTDKGRIYTQEIAINNVTENTQVDLTPSDEQMDIFSDKDLAFVVTNEARHIIVSAIGEKPTNDYTMQATVTEVVFEQSAQEGADNEQ